MEVDSNLSKEQILLNNISIAKAANDDLLLARAYGNYAYHCYKEQTPEEALIYFELSIQLYEKLGNKKTLSFLYNDYGLVFFNLQNYAKALNAYFHSLKLYKKRDNSWVPGRYKTNDKPAPINDMDS